ncbi:MAG: hypothetical protein ACO1RX_20410 [Candidatus Sericytochromatia bacterium]
MYDTPEFKTNPDVVYSPKELKLFLDFTLRQDMFQVTFPNHYLIDVGWYPTDSDAWLEYQDQTDHDSSGLSLKGLLDRGRFQITLVKDENWWSDDTLSDNCQTLQELEQLMQQFLGMVRSKL